MKIFLYDEKHENIEEARRIVEFLDRNNMTDKYRRLVIAESFRIVYDAENDVPEIVFKY